VEPPVGYRGKAPGQGANSGGILISHDKNKIETEEINSDTSQMEK